MPSGAPIGPVVCREPSKYFVCHNGTDSDAQPDPMWINAQGVMCLADGTFVGQKGPPAAEIHEKAYAYGYGTPYDRLRAVDRHISTRCRGFGYYCCISSSWVIL
jgi:hypothetical protein